MTPLSPTQISPGIRLAFDVFDHGGELILLRGGLIASEIHAQKLKKAGYRNPPATNSLATFAAMAGIAGRVSHVLQDIAEQREGGVWIKRIRHLVSDFLDICDSDPDAAFASIHLDTLHSYLVVHSMMAGLVSYRLALANGLDRAQRSSLVAAALTHDIGLLPMYQQINANELLKSEDRERVRKHADDSLAMLKALGVDDPIWLEAVRDHHEFLDGSGYGGKTGDDLSLVARIIALADSYSAMLRSRPYRERVTAHNALEALYAHEIERYDGYLLEALIWDFGLYPPGSLLRLANREMAVVIRNSPGLLDSPQAAALTDPRGHPYLKPVLRDTQVKEFAIIETLDPAMAVRAGQLINACWNSAGLAKPPR
jgi:HD-GYP domain-containing protein (c-di-GMP phosphodiesterase class II)